MNLRNLLEAAAESGPDRVLFSLCPVAKGVHRCLATGKTQQAGRLMAENDCASVPSCLNCKRGQESITAILARGSDFPGIGVDFLSTHVDALWDTSGGFGDHRQFLSFCSIGKRIRDTYQSLEGMPAAKKVSAFIAEEYGCFDVDSCLQCDRGVDAIEGALAELCEQGLEGPIGQMLSNPYL